MERSKKIRSTLPETNSRGTWNTGGWFRWVFPFGAKKASRCEVLVVEEFDPFWKGRTTKCVEQQNDVDIVYLRLFLGWSTFPKTNMSLEDDPASFWTRLPF